MVNKFGISGKDYEKIYDDSVETIIIILCAVLHEIPIYLQ